MADDMSADDAELGAVAMADYRSAVGLVTAIYGLRGRRAWSDASTQIELTDLANVFAGPPEAKQRVLEGLCSLALDLVDELSDATGEDASSILQRLGLYASGG